MRTSLRKIELIDQAVYGKKPEYKLLLDAHTQLDPKTADEVLWQRTVYSSVDEYGHQLLRQDIKTVEKELFNRGPDSSFKAKILSLFNS